MTSQGHFVAPVDFPVWAIAFTRDNELAVTGGGGAGRSGVKNSISIYDIDVRHRKCTRKAELELSKNEDAPMTMAAHPERKQLLLGINSEASKVKEGSNDNLRVFSYTEDAIKAETSTSTMTSKDPEEYQKITALSRDGSKVAVGSSKSQMSFLSLDGLQRILPDVDFTDDELFDADFNDDGAMVLGAASQKICIYAVPASAETGTEKNAASKDAVEPIQVIERPVLKQSLKCTFRAAKFGRKSSSQRLYTLVNATPESATGLSRKQQKAARSSAEKKAFISVWDTGSWSLIKTRTVAKKPVTSFDVSPDGRMLAIGCADLSISIFDAQTVRPLLSVLAAHDFPSTCLRFSPDSKLLVSGSADNTLRVISADKALHPSRHAGLQILLFTILIVLIAILIQMYAGDKVLAFARQHLHV